MVTTRRRLGGGAGRRLERLALAFDDERAVANAGLVLVSTLTWRLGIEQLIDEVLDLGERPGAARPGRKLLTLVFSALVGGDSIDDAGVLRCGETERVLAHRVMAPSTLGTFLRSFTFGHVRQLDRAFETILGRAWEAGAGAGLAAVDDRSRLDDRRGRRTRQAGRRLRLHEAAWLSPDSGDPLRHG